MKGTCMKPFAKAWIACIIAFFACCPGAMAQTATDAIRQPVNQVLSILADPAYKGQEGQKVQKEKLWKIIEQMFDFTEVSKRALGRNWRQFSPQERGRFRDVFSKFLGNIYLGRLQGGFEGEKVQFVGQQSPGANKAVVKTKIVRDSVQIPVDYKMTNKKGPWKIYDVNVEGVSLIKNYRSQFNKFLMNKKPRALIEKLTAKLKKQEQGKKD